MIEIRLSDKIHAIAYNGIALYGKRLYLRRLSKARFGVFGMDEIEEIGLLLKAAMRESERRVNDLLRPLDLTVSQAEALDIIDRSGPMSLGELGALLVAEGGHPSRLVDRMVKAGLITRQAPDDDRRRIELAATDRGRELAVQARKCRQGFRLWVSGQLKGVDLTQMRSFFDQYLANTEMGETVRQRRNLGARNSKNHKMP